MLEIFSGPLGKFSRAIKWFHVVFDMVSFVEVLAFVPSVYETPWSLVGFCPSGLLYLGKDVHELHCTWKRTLFILDLVVAYECMIARSIYCSVSIYVRRHFKSIFHPLP